MCVSTTAHSTLIVVATHYWCVLSCLRKIFCTCTHVEDFAPVALAIMATSDRQLPNLGAHNKLNQPLQFDFLKHEFGKTRVVKRAFLSLSGLGSGHGYIMTAPGIWSYVILVSPLSRQGN